jgi:hypothetical protein
MAEGSPVSMTATSCCAQDCSSEWSLGLAYCLSNASPRRDKCGALQEKRKAHSYRLNAFVAAGRCAQFPCMMLSHMPYCNAL